MGKGKEKKLSSKAQAEVDLEAANIDRAGAAFGVQLAALNKLNEVRSASGSTHPACSPTATAFVIPLNWLFAVLGCQSVLCRAHWKTPPRPCRPLVARSELGLDLRDLSKRSNR